MLDKQDREKMFLKFFLILHIMCILFYRTRFIFAK